MATIFNNLKEYIKEEITKNKILSPLNKNNLIELININLKSLNNINITFQAFSSSNKTLYNAYRDRLKNTKIKVNNNILQIPLMFPRLLSGTAKSMEDNRFLSSIQKTVSILIDFNESVLKNINDIITQDSVVINNVRVLDTYCVSVIEQTKSYCDFCYDLFGLISYVINDFSQDYPKYRQLRLTNNYPLFIEITNQLCNSKNNVSILKDVKTIKSNGFNFKLNDTSVGAVSSINNNILSKRVVTGLHRFLGFPNPFRYVCDLYVDMRHAIFSKNKDEKEWLEFHVSMLKMKLNQIDPNSEEYIRLSKAVEFYEDQIAKKQRKIDDYLNRKG